jgi:quercetin dioxygenase-like cupin family protein
MPVSQLSDGQVHTPDTECQDVRTDIKTDLKVPQTLPSLPDDERPILVLVFVRATAFVPQKGGAGGGLENRPLTSRLAPRSRTWGTIVPWDDQLRSSRTEFLMPNVAEGEALNRPFLDLDALARWQGSPPWQTCLVETPGLRVVLYRWPAGVATVPHVHPASEGTFQVLRGRAVFAIGNAPEREVGPGEFVLARCGVRHSISVMGDTPLMLLVTIAPNDGRRDETIAPA